MTSENAPSHSSLLALKKHQTAEDDSSLPPAGPGARFLAQLLDGVFSQTISALILALVGSLGLPATGMNNLIIILGVSLGYTVLPLYAWGQTLGKKVMKIKVVHTENGGSLGLGQIFLREFLGRTVVGLTLGLGYLGILRREDRRGLHDLIGKTKVVTFKT